MHVLRLRADASDAGALRAPLRELAASVPPERAGLCGRSWTLDGRTLRGCFIFRDRSSLDEFAGDPLGGDPAARALFERLALPHPVIDEIAGSEGQAVRAPVVIVSAPRAGSTLLYEILAECPDLWTIGGESHGVLEGIPQLHPAARGYASHALTASDATPEVARVVRAGFAAALRDRDGFRYAAVPKAVRTPVRLLEKTPENALRIPFIRAIFPDAHLVVLHRAMRESVASIVETWGHDGFVNLPALPGWNRGAWHLLLPAGWEQHDESSLVDIAAFQWTAANAAILDAVASVPAERLLFVSYRELVEHPTDTVKRICRFAGVRFDGRVASAARNLPISSTTTTHPDPNKWKRNAAVRDAVLPEAEAIDLRLRDLNGGFTKQRAVAAPRMPSFACFLDENDADAGCAALAPNSYRVADGFRFQRGATPPLDVVRRTRFRGRFLADYPIAWVDDAVTRTFVPFWTRRQHVAALAALVPGEAAPATLPQRLVAPLLDAGILVDPHAPRRTTLTAEDVEQAREDLQTRGFCRLPQLVHPRQTAALSRYYRELVASGCWPLGDDQVAVRHGWQNEMLARHFNEQFAALVSHLVGETLKPTYAFACVYQAGAVLGQHVDREQCFVTLSLLLDEEPAGVCPWPLYVESNGEITSIASVPGDAMLFRGQVLTHWREPLPPGRSAAVLLFHFVRESFGKVLF